MFKDLQAERGKSSLIHCLGLDEDLTQVRLEASLVLKPFCDLQIPGANPWEFFRRITFLEVASAGQGKKQGVLVIERHL